MRRFILTLVLIVATANGCAVSKYSLTEKLNVSQQEAKRSAGGDKTTYGGEVTITRSW